MHDATSIQEILETCEAGILQLAVLKDANPVEYASLQCRLLELVSPALLSTVDGYHQMSDEQNKNLHTLTSRLHSA